MLTYPTGAGPVVYAKEYSYNAIYTSKMFCLNFEQIWGLQEKK